MKRRWLRWAAGLFAVLIAGSFGLSLAFQGGWARRSLLARLSAGFGRPVEVGQLGFSLLQGFRLEAQSVTVYDDPHFGQEYFLRARQLTASVHWSALLRGRFEFDTVSLDHPSLNLVRLPDGRWNIESWLPPLPSADSGVRAGAGVVAERISRVEVQDGRINFKLGSRKLPLALVAVTGGFDQDAAGHWNIDVQANPMRAPASLQQAGTLRVRGVVGGVSTRLRPASLALRWEDASLADLSRLVQGGDYGVRGILNAEMTARIDNSPSPANSWGEWSVEGKIRLQGVHGWALAGRPEDPGANLNFQAKWRPAESRLQFSRLVVEAPHSRLAATADLDWSHDFHTRAEMVSSRVGLADLLAWRRAFRAGVSDDLAVEGALEARATLSGWPLRVDDLALTSAGATIRSPVLPGPVRLGPLSTQWADGTLKFRSTPVSLPVAAPVRSPARGNATPDSPPSSSALLVGGTVGPLAALNAVPDARYRLTVAGLAPRAQDLLAVLRAWGWSRSSSWTVAGPVSLQLAWMGSLRSGTSVANGTIQARGLQVTTALMNRPLLVTAAAMELRGGQPTIKFQSVQAVGAQWSGSLRGPAEDGGWEFDLSADRLDAAEFYAWLSSPDRPNLLRRLLPFGSDSARNAAAGRANALKTLQAHGRLRVAELRFAPLQVEQIDAAATIDGPSLSLRQGRANLLGGQFSGNFEARLSAEPAYSLEGQFARLDLRDIAQTVSLPGRVHGRASGELQLSARGSDRAAIAASLQGEGLLRAREASLGQFELTPASTTVVFGPSPGIESRPFALTASFQVGAGRLRLERFLLVRPGEQTEVSGTVDFARQLDLRVQSSPLSPRSISTPLDNRRLTGDSWTVAGTLDEPRVTFIPAPVASDSAAVPSAGR
jgi:hypothetical protein